MSKRIAPEPPPPAVSARPKCAGCRRALRPHFEPTSSGGKRLGGGAWLTFSPGRDPFGWFGKYVGYPRDAPIFCRMDCALAFAVYVYRELKAGKLRRSG
jgi:hypothetical protein